MNCKMIIPIIMALPVFNASAFKITRIINDMSHGAVFSSSPIGAVHSINNDERIIGFDSEDLSQSGQVFFIAPKVKNVETEPITVENFFWAFTGAEGKPHRLDALSKESENLWRTFTFMSEEKEEEETRRGSLTLKNFSNLNDHDEFVFHIMANGDWTIYNTKEQPPSYEEASRQKPGSASGSH